MVAAHFRAEEATDDIDELLNEENNNSEDM